MPNNRLAEDHADRLEKSWFTKQEKNRNSTSSSRFRFWKTKRRTNSTTLALALNDVCFRWFWLGVSSNYVEIYLKWSRRCSSDFSSRPYPTHLSTPYEQVSATRSACFWYSSSLSRPMCTASIAHTRLEFCYEVPLCMSSSAGQRCSLPRSQN